MSVTLSRTSSVETFIVEEPAKIIVFTFTGSKSQYKVNSEAFKKLSKMVLNSSRVNVKSGTEDALIFVIKYINTYSEKFEIPAPDFPLTEDSPLTEIFEYETHIFGDLLNISDKQNLQTKLNFITEIVNIAEELGLEILFNKVSAIVCVYIQELFSQFT